MSSQDTASMMHPGRTRRDLAALFAAILVAGVLAPSLASAHVESGQAETFHRYCTPDCNTPLGML